MDKSHILRRCAFIVPNLMAQIGIQVDSCVLQGRIIIESLKHFGIDSVPIPCTVEIYNAPLAERIKSGNGPNSVEELSEEEWSVGIGFGEDRPGYWGGHLIVGDPDNWVMDASLGQANRPNHGIMLSPLLSGMPDKFMDGGCFFIQQHDCLLAYVVRISNTRYQQGRDWRDKDKWGQYVGMTIRAIKGETVTLR